ncbi:hypothetical protein [Desulfocicer niacini]
MKPFRLSQSVAIVIFLFTAITCCQIFPMSARAQVQQVTILPFTMNAEKDLTYIQEGISHMLSSRISRKEKTIIVPGKAIIDKIHNARTLSGDALIKAVAGNTPVDYIIAGSITEFAGSFSLDTRVYSSVSSTPLHTFFSQADSLDGIIPAMNRIAGEINNQVFHRETPGMLNADAAPPPQTKDLTRANPETLIPQIPMEMTAKKKPFWMFWKKTKPEDEEKDFEIPEVLDEVNADDVEKKDKPVWKFW